MYGVGNRNKRLIKYEESKSHLILTTIINFGIVYSMYIAFLSAFNSFLGEAFIQKDFFTTKNGRILCGITLLVVIIYSLLLSERAGFLTPGEKITGRNYIGIRKLWVNPYQKNRALLFVFFMINMYIIVNYFGGSPAVYTGMGFAREVITWVIHIILLIKIGEGKINALLVLIVLNIASMMVTIFSNIDISKGISIGVFMGFIIFYSITYFVYRNKEQF